MATSVFIETDAATAEVKKLGEWTGTEAMKKIDIAAFGRAHAGK